MTRTTIHGTYVVRSEPLRNVGVMPAVVTRAAPHQPVRRLLQHYASLSSTDPTRQRAHRTREQRLMTRHARRNRHATRLPRRSVRVERQNPRRTIGTHDHPNSQIGSQPPPRHKPLRFLLQVVDHLAVLKVHAVLQQTALAEQTCLAQQVHITTSQSLQNRGLLYPELAGFVNVVVAESECGDGLDVACPIYILLPNTRTLIRTCNRDFTRGDPSPNNTIPIRYPF